MKVRDLLLFCLVLFLASVATGQNTNPAQIAKGLVWGNGSILTGGNKPTAGQAICNVNGTLQGCAGGGGAGGCNGTVNCVNGVGLFVNSCVTPNTTICFGRDTTATHNNFPVTWVTLPSTGSTTFTCNQNDTLQITCVQ